MIKIIRDPQVSTLWISGKSYMVDKRIHDHKHEFYQLIYVLNGKEKIIINKEIYYLNKNGIALINSNANHSYKFLESTKVIDVKFKMNEDFKNLIPEIFITPVNQITNEYIIENARLLLNLATSFDSKAKNIYIEIDTRLKLLLLQIYRLLKSGHSNLQEEFLGESVFLKNSKVSEMIKFIQNNYNKNISLIDIENEFHYSSQNIIKLFKSNTGVTPVKYIQNYKLEKSLSILEKSNKTISKIAIELGMNPNYYSKIFLQKYGILPTKYRKKYRDKKVETITLSSDFDIDTQPKT